MKAIIMAGGEGSRLRPLTCDIPKPMVPVMNRPVMEYSIELLKENNITDIGVTLQYLPEQITSFFDNGSEWGVCLHYFIEETPLGTAGSVKNAEEFLDETFVVISGDALTDIDLSKAIEFHKNKGSMATLVTKKVNIPLEYGVIITDKSGSITRFLEKPGWGEVFSDTVNTGIYILEPEILQYVEKGRMFDFSKDLFPILLKEQKPMYGYVADGYWCDIGNLQQYLQAHYDVMNGKVKIPLKATMIKEGLWVEDGAVLDEDAIIHTPAYIGSETEIKRGTLIDSYTVIGSNCRLDEKASIKRSVLWNHVMVERNAELRGATLCNHVKVQKNACIYEEAVIGENSVIGERSIIKPNTKIWPGKTVEAASVVNKNIIWGTRQSRTIFGQDGITGMVNVDLTPEFVTCLSASFGATFSGNARIGVGYGGNNGALMLMEAMKAGLLSQGIEVFEMGQLTTPMMRYSVRYFGLQGGIHIHNYERDAEHALIEIMDSRGANISRSLEKKIENLYVRQDFKRVSALKIPKYHLMNDIPLFYMRSLINSVDSNGIKQRKPKVVIAGQSQLTLQLFSTILKEVGCSVEENLLTGSEMNGNEFPGEEVILKMSQFIVENGMDLGVIIDSNGEKVSLFDENGKYVQGDLLVALFSLMILKSYRYNSLIIPLNAPRVIENMANRYKAKVIRTKTSRQSVMESLFDCSPEELNSRIEIFNLYFDGIAGTLKVIELLCKWDSNLSELLADIPDFHMNYKTVECPWGDKGKVIRSLIEEEKEGDVELLEGVKVINDKGWALVLPDADAPLCKVYCEGFSEEYAESLTDMYIEKIEKIRKS